MRSRDICLIAMFAALLIGVQFALSFVAGVELVTVTIVVFSSVFGAKRGVATAVIFSIIRCIVWGFYPTVIVLYLIYFPLLSLISAVIGHIKDSDARYILTAVSACVMTVIFTLLDDVITPLIMGFNGGAWRAYFYASVPAMLAQTICTAASVLILFPPLTTLLRKMKTRYFSADTVEAN